MSMPDEAGRAPHGQESLPAAGAQKKPGILTKSKDFLQGAMDSLSGKELPRLVEEFTQEMVVVAEGLSADQESLRATAALQGESLDQLAETLRLQEKKLTELTRKVDALGAANEKRRKGESGLARILRQATWLAAIIGASWVIVTLVNALAK